MIARRRVVCVLGVATLALPLAPFAQQRPAKISRLGCLVAATASMSRVEAQLRSGLHDLGYVEGTNIDIEFRFAEGKYERLAGMAAELVALKVDVIVVAQTPALQAVQKATTTIPIVFVGVGDPVGAGFVASLSQPGGNITGLSNVTVDLSNHYLELLRVTIPELSLAAVLLNPGNSNHSRYLKNVQASAKAISLSVSPFQASTATEIETASVAMTREPTGALIVLPDPFFFTQRRQIAELARTNRWPTMFPNREFAEAGGLMSYGQDLTGRFRRAATYVDKILKGAKPGDLPVEQPTKLELVVNLKTAKAMGLTIPQDLLVRADEVIE
jgi:putative ABC transport system substrate-binding protein